MKPLTFALTSALTAAAENAAAAPSAAVPPVESPAPKSKITIAEIPSKSAPGRPAAKRTTASAVMVIPADKVAELLAVRPFLKRVILPGAPILAGEAERNALIFLYENTLKMPVPEAVIKALDTPRGHEKLSLEQVAARNQDAKLSIVNIRAALTAMENDLVRQCQLHDPEIAAQIAAEQQKAADLAAAAAAAKEESKEGEENAEPDAVKNDADDDEVEDVDADDADDA